jgi:hypothetical protein
MTLVARRAVRLARTGSPRLAARAAAREAVALRDEAGLRRAARGTGRILVGPFVGEVGYELLYWIPFVRRTLRRHGIPPERVVVLARGGAGAWYGDLAAESVEILDLVDPERFRSELLARRGRAGDAKQMQSDPFDAALVEQARERVGAAHVLHPRLMYTRLRFVWEGLEEPGRALARADYAPLPHVAPGVELPERFVALKAYFSSVLPDTAPTRAVLAALVERLAQATDVVVLANPVPPDEHEELRAAGARVVDAGAWLAPRDNLAVQTAIVGRARALVSTYGGFAYLGPLLGVQTVALHVGEADNPRHLAIAEAALPGPGLEHVRLDAASAVDEVAEAVAR